MYHEKIKRNAPTTKEKFAIVRLVQFIVAVINLLTFVMTLEQKVLRLKERGDKLARNEFLAFKRWWNRMVPTYLRIPKKKRTRQGK